MSTQDTHIDFIRARLPVWLTRATRARQTRFKVLTRQLQRDSDALNALLSDLPGPYAFTLDRLKTQPEVQDWNRVIGPGTVADAVRRARVRRSSFVTDPSLSVIEAVMRNYPPADAVAGSDFDNKGELFIQGWRGSSPKGRPVGQGDPGHAPGPFRQPLSPHGCGRGLSTVARTENASYCR